MQQQVPINAVLDRNDRGLVPNYRDAFQGQATSEMRIGLLSTAGMPETWDRRGGEACLEQSIFIEHDFGPLETQIVVLKKIANPTGLRALFLAIWFDRQALLPAILVLNPS